MRPHVMAAAVLLSGAAQFLCALHAGATPLDLLVGACLSTLEEATGHPAWKLQGLGVTAARLVSDCETNPYQTIVKVKGVGNAFTSMPDLVGRAARPKESITK